MGGQGSDGVDKGLMGGGSPYSLSMLCWVTLKVWVSSNRLGVQIVTDVVDRKVTKKADKFSKSLKEVIRNILRLFNSD